MNKIKKIIIYYLLFIELPFQRFYVYNVNINKTM